MRMSSKHDAICLVCGDKASGKHYGVTSCDGCRGFFKRSIRRNLDYICKEKNKCIVDVTRRNQCQACRFAKCLSVNMKKDAVQHERAPRSSLNSNLELNYLPYSYYNPFSYFHPIMSYQVPSTFPHFPRTPSEQFMSSSMLGTGESRTLVSPHTTPIYRPCGIINPFSSFRSIRPAYQGINRNQQKASSVPTRQSEVREGLLVNIDVESSDESERIRKEYCAMIPPQTIREGVLINYDTESSDENVAPSCSTQDGSSSLPSHSMRIHRLKSFSPILIPKPTVDFVLPEEMGDKTVFDNKKWFQTNLTKGPLVESALRIVDMCTRWPKAFPTYTSLPHVLRIELFSRTWREIFLLVCAQNSIKFPEDRFLQRSSDKQPCVIRDLNKLVANINKLNLDNIEYGYLKTIVFFRPDESERDCLKSFDSIHEKALSKLRIYCESKNVQNRFAKILLTLPEVYCFANCACVETLSFRENDKVTFESLYLLHWDYDD